MRPNDLAKRLGVTKGTVINWSHWYGDFFSPSPPAGEARFFTDNDVRVIVFINDLSKKGMNRPAIADALQRKRESGVPFPSPSPDFFGDESAKNPLPDSRTALTLPEAQTLITALETQVSEMRRQMEAVSQQHKEERTQHQEEINSLLNRYLGLMEQHSKEVADLHRQISRLSQQHELSQMSQEIEQLRWKLEAADTNNTALSQRLKQLEDDQDK